jgi:NADH-quinone oxidoreductase subunit B
MEEGDIKVGFLEKRFHKPNIITVPYDKIMNAARSRSLWYLTFGVACCAIEFMASAASHYDFERYGMFFRASPRQVDMIIISGTIVRKYAPVVKRIYEQIAEPKYVVAMGSCAITGGPFYDSYTVVQGVDKVIPVDVYVQGCPPRPEALYKGLLKLKDVVNRQTIVVK